MNRFFDINKTTILFAESWFYCYYITNQIGVSRPFAVAKKFDDKMFSDRRVTAYHAYARDNLLMRII